MPTSTSFLFLAKSKLFVDTFDVILPRAKQRAMVEEIVIVRSH